MNETVYHDPSSFNPSRYLSRSEGGQEEPRPLAHFGFGRRQGCIYNFHQTQGFILMLDPEYALADISQMLVYG